MQILRVFSLPSLALALGLLALAAGQNLFAGIVTTAVDENNVVPGAGLSLREAIAAAVPGETITFDPSLDGATITLGGTQLLIDQSLIIDASSLPDGITISGNNASRIFEVTAGNSVVIESLSITRGKAPNGATGATGTSGITGIGITVPGGPGGPGGPGQHGGGVLNHGDLTLNRVTLSGNSAGDGGTGGSGGPGNPRGGPGIGGAGGSGGALHNSLTGTLTLSNCTLSLNNSGKGGNGGFGFNFIFGNYQGGGGPGGSGGGLNNLGALDLSQVTIARNIARAGGSGLFASSPGSGGGIANSGSLTVNNSILALNTGSPISDLSGPFEETGVNWVDDGDPMLGALGDYGGPTQTILPLPGSPVIDAAGSTDPGGTDQRGAARFVNGALDIGAVEFLVPVVNTSQDEDNVFPGAGFSLREIIAATAPGGTITFDASLSGQTIALGGTQLLIDKDLTIDASALPNGITIDGNSASRVFEVAAGNTVVMESLTITGGKAPNGAAGAPGTSGRRNFPFPDLPGGAGGPGLPGQDGGGVLNNGDLTLNRVTLSANAAGDGGSGGSGGSGSTRGEPGSGGTGGRGGALHNSLTGTLTLSNCTLSLNNSGSGGNGGFGFSFIFGNYQGLGGAGGSGGGLNNLGALDLSQVTIARNIARAGGSGFFLIASSPGSGGGIANSGSLTVNNSILALNTGREFPDLEGPITVETGANLIGVDPLLSPLDNYGGPTKTIYPLPGSPAIDAAIASTLARDQRGFPRPAGAAADIGAVESQGPFVVTTEQDEDGIDPGDGLSLREAIQSADPGAVITFDPSLDGATITLGGSQLGIDKSLTIDASALPGGITISGDGASRVFEVNSPGGTVRFHKLTIRDGDDSSFLGAGGIKLQSGSLEVFDSTISGNSFDGLGAGGGLYAGRGTNLIVDRSTISGNSAGRGGGIGADELSTVQVSNSTIANNAAVNGDGGAIINLGAFIIITHTTITGNSASSLGGGISQYGDAPSLTIQDSIVAGNTAPTAPDINKISGTVTPSGASLIGINTTVETEFPDGPLVGTSAAPVDAQLAPLGDYGGPTETMRPLAGSPALDVADATALLTDQRGFARPVGVAGDLGAVEVQSTAVQVLNAAVTLSPTFTWSAPDATSALLFLGTDPNSLGSLGPQSSPFTLDSALVLNTTYYWRLDLTIDGELIPGVVYSFVTRPAQLEVNTVLDENDGVTVGDVSLREAIAESTAGETITFAPALDGQALTLGGTQLLIDKNLTIDASALPDGITISGDNASRIFEIAAGSSVVLDSLNLTAGAANQGAAILNSGTLALTASTLSENSASEGGALYNDGDLTLTNATLAGNSADTSGGAIHHAGGTLILDHVTLSGNTTEGAGGALYHAAGDLTLINSILGANTASTTGPDLHNEAGVVIPLAVNLIGDLAASGLSAASGIVTGDPVLAPLADNGGPTPTMMVMPGSPAIDAGGATTLLTDQRGFERALAGGPDLGAYEAAAGSYNSDGMTVYAKLDPALTGDGVQFEISADPDFRPTVSTLAGTGEGGATDAPRLAAEFTYPGGVAQDDQGNIFVADVGNNRIRMISPAGEVSTIAGSGVYGFFNGPGLTAAFKFPVAVAVGPDNNLYVSDIYNHCIRKLTRPSSPGQPWDVSTLAGTGLSGFVDGEDAEARFRQPRGLVVGPDNDLYVADSFNHRIRKVTLDGDVTTYAGSGSPILTDCATTDGETFVTCASTDSLTLGKSISGPNLATGTTIASIIDSTTFELSAPATGSGTELSLTVYSEGPRENATFNVPFDVAFDSFGNLFVADRDNHLIRRIDEGTGFVSTLAGQVSTTGFLDGTGADARFNTPIALAVDDQDNLFVADENNHSIRKVTSEGVVTTGVGTGVIGFQDGDSSVAQFHCPADLLVDLNQDLIVADAQNHVLRRVIVNPIQVPAVVAPGGADVSAVINAGELGLASNQTYYVRWRSLDDDSTQLLGQSFFLVDPPVVVTAPASNLTPSTARLNATVDPNNSPTQVYFEYSTDPQLAGPLRVNTLVDGSLDSPRGVAVDGAGPTRTIYLADRGAHQILVFDAAGNATGSYGSGVAGFADGPGASARFDHPSGLALDGNSLYVADEENHRIRRIDLTTGEVSTFAGSGLAGFVDSADGAPRFLNPTGLTVDSTGHLYIADSRNHRIRRVTPAGEVSTVAGNGTKGFANSLDAATARFDTPLAVAVTSTGLVYVADTGNHRIRAIIGNRVSTVAGSGTADFLNATGSAAQFASPTGIAIDGNDVIYVTDRDNHRIRRVAANGEVTTLAGSALSGLVDSPTTELHPATATGFDLPVAIAADGEGRLYVSEGGNQALRILTRDPLSTVTATPDLVDAGNQSTSVDLPEILLPGATYYFRAVGTNGRNTPIAGEILSFVTPQSGIVTHNGDSTAAPVVTPGQDLALGATPFDTPVTRTFTIENIGGFELEVVSVVLGTPSSGAFSLSGNTGLTLVPPGGSTTFEVTLLSGSAGLYRDEIIITSSDLEAGTIRFTVSGEILAPPLLSNLAHRVISPTDVTLSATVHPAGSTTEVAFQFSRFPDFEGALEIVTKAGSEQGSAAEARFHSPSDVVVDPIGNLYVADTLNHCIRKITPVGDDSVLAGSGVPGFDDGVGAAAQFNAPKGIAIDSAGVLYVADTLNHLIRCITPAGEVTTVAGTRIPAFTDGIASAARFNQPTGIAIDADGNLYIADSGNNRVRKIDTVNDVSTLAGPTDLDSPQDVAIDSAGNIFVADLNNDRIRKIAPDGTISTLAGTGFSGPAGVAVDSADHVYVADRDGHRIVRVDPAGQIAVLAGLLDSPGSNDGSGTDTRFNGPSGLAVDSAGTIFVADRDNHRMRKINLAARTVVAATGLNGTDPIAVEVDLSDLEPNTVYYYRAITNNGGGAVISPFTPPSFSFTTSSLLFMQWQESAFGSDSGDPSIAGPLADPSGDGVVNLQKYAFGLDPLLNSRSGLPLVAQVPGGLTLTYTKVLAATDLTYQVQWSTNLLDWSTVDVTEQILSDDGATQQILATIPTGMGSCKFVRLSLSSQQP